MSGRVAIIDYGMGNLLSVRNALEMIGAEPRVTNGPDDLARCDRVVLPGVGAFEDCLSNLRSAGYDKALDSFRATGRPILGICLGMQAMARKSFEFGEHDGLGWFDAEVVKLEPGDPAKRVPHVGWNDVDWTEGSPFSRNLPSGAEFYFVHSFQMRCSDQKDLSASCEYGELVTAAVRRENLFATQFHPEKSQDHGLTVLENFMAWNP